MTVSDLGNRSDRSSRVDVPVTYADVGNLWLRYRELGADVDFVTVHFLPYREDVPPRRRRGGACGSRPKAGGRGVPRQGHPDRRTGRPSHGRMRDGALPSRINQARFVSEILDRARRDNFRVNLFEAYDEPWKRVGRYRGRYRACSTPTDRKLNIPPMRPSAITPIGSCRSGAEWFSALAYRRSLADAAAPAIVAAVRAMGCGGDFSRRQAELCSGERREDAISKVTGSAARLVQGLMLALGIIAPLLSADALIAGHALRRSFKCWDRRKAAKSLMTKMLGARADPDHPDGRGNGAGPGIRRTLARFSVSPL